ncbi:MAG: hypothetical protein WCT77_01965 [Bacteroidota bacterium]|jgi:hypothetical protein
MLQFGVGLFSYHKDDNIFIAESSTLNLPAQYWNGTRLRPVEPIIELSNYDTGGSRQFKFVNADIHDGEAMGWNYESKDGIKLLIIND